MTVEPIAPSHGVLAFLRRHQLVAFVALAYALSWWPWLWYRVDPVAADAPILPFGPFLAAIIMLAIVGGWPAVRAWLGRIVHWRVGWHWYALALLLPVALTSVAVGIALLSGAKQVASFLFSGERHDRQVVGVGGSDF